MATTPTDVKLDQLVINSVESQEVYKKMEEQGLINENEIYLVDGGDAQELITANGILKGDGQGNITAAETVEAEVVDIPTGILKGTSSGLEVAVAGVDYADVSSLSKKPDTNQAITNIHVAKTGNDSTADGSVEKPYLTIQAAVNSLPILLLYRVNIYIHGGAYDEDVLVEKLVGADSLQIENYNSETVSVKTMLIRYCNFGNGVYVKGIDFTGNNSNYGWSFYSTNVNLLALENVSSTHSVASSKYGAFTFHLCNGVRIISITISNKVLAIDCLCSTIYLNSNTTGTGNTGAIRAGSGWGSAGGIVFKNGSAIEGTDSTSFGGQIFYNNNAAPYSAYNLRGTKLASSDTTPTANGQICWTYS